MYMTISHMFNEGREGEGMTGIRKGRNGDAINLFTRRIAIISCIKNIASIDKRSFLLGSTLGTGMSNLKYLVGDITWLVS